MSSRPGVAPSLPPDKMWLDRYATRPKRRLTRAGCMLVVGFIVAVAFLAAAGLILSGAWQQ